MKNKIIITLATVIMVGSVFFLLTVPTACKVHYGFQNVGSIPDSIKTVKVLLFENRANYINPEMSNLLTEKLRLKITQSTRLKQTNDDPDWLIQGVINNYNISTQGISNSTTSVNRLTVGVTILRKNKYSDKEETFNATRTWDYDATLTLQQAEQKLKDDIVSNLTDEIFNQLFSNW